MMPQKFCDDTSNGSGVIALTDKQTNRQTDRQTDTTENNTTLAVQVVKIRQKFIAVIIPTECRQTNTPVAYLEICKGGIYPGVHLRCSFSKVSRHKKIFTLNISTKKFHLQRGPGARVPPYTPQTPVSYLEI